MKFYKYICHFTKQICNQQTVLFQCFREFSFTFASQMYLEMVRGRNHESVSAYVHDTHYHDKFGQIMENYHKKIQ